MSWQKVGGETPGTEAQAALVHIDDEHFATSPLASNLLRLARGSVDLNVRHATDTASASHWQLHLGPKILGRLYELRATPKRQHEHLRDAIERFNRRFPEQAIADPNGNARRILNCISRLAPETITRTKARGELIAIRLHAEDNAPSQSRDVHRLRVDTVAGRSAVRSTALVDTGAQDIRLNDEPSAQALSAASWHRRPTENGSTAFLKLFLRSRTQELLFLRAQGSDEVEDIWLSRQDVESLLEREDNGRRTGFLAEHLMRAHAYDVHQANAVAETMLAVMARADPSGLKQGADYYALDLNAGLFAR